MSTTSVESSVATPATSRIDVAVSALAGLVVVGPLIALDLSSWSVNGSLWYLGLLPALIGLFTGPRTAFSAAVLTPVIVGVSLLLRDLPPIVGSAYMLLLGIATGLSAMRGWHLMFSFAAPLAALALIGNMHVALPWGQVPADSSTEAIGATLAIMLAGGLWTASFGPVALRRIKISPPLAVPARTAWYYATSMGGLVAVASFVALTWLPANSWWMVLTMYVVVQPHYADSLTRVGHRITGTLVGSTAAVIIVAAFHHLPGLITALATVLTVLAAWANLKQPYWVFVTFLTPAVVLQTAGGTRDLAHAIVDRAGYTLIGSIIATMVLAGGHMYLIRHHERNTTAM